MKEIPSEDERSEYESQSRDDDTVDASKTKLNRSVEKVNLAPGSKLLWNTHSHQNHVRSHHTQLQSPQVNCILSP